MPKISLQTEITETQDNLRLDQALSQLFPQYSRSLLQTWIKAGNVNLDGETILQKRHPVKIGQNVLIDAELEEKTVDEAEPIPLDIVHEDAAIIVINKPANLVVHPGAGNPSSTLVNALLHHFPDLAQLPRAGIIHRLDKDTTGLLMIARTLESHTELVRQLQARTVKRQYQATVMGDIISGGDIDAPIGRHPKLRTKMAVTGGGKEARTRYRVIERFNQHTQLRLQLDTGRTHQIRVHMAHIDHPIVGDKVYNRRIKLPKGASETLKKMLQTFPRQALHAEKIEIIHPVTNEPMEWSIPLPDDMQQLLEALRGG